MTFCINNLTFSNFTPKVCDHSAKLQSMVPLTMYLMIGFSRVKTKKFNPSKKKLYSKSKKTKNKTKKVRKQPLQKYTWYHYLFQKIDMK